MHPSKSTTRSTPLIWRRSSTRRTKSRTRLPRTYLTAWTQQPSPQIINHSIINRLIWGHTDRKTQNCPSFTTITPRIATMTVANACTAQWTSESDSSRAEIKMRSQISWTSSRRTVRIRTLSRRFYCRSVIFINSTIPNLGTSKTRSNKDRRLQVTRKWALIKLRSWTAPSGNWPTENSSGTRDLVEVHSTQTVATWWHRTNRHRASTSRARDTSLIEKGASDFATSRCQRAATW